MGGSLMTATPAALCVARLTVTRSVLRRSLIAGSAWGISVAALLIAREYFACGSVCLPDAAVTTALTVTAGVLTIGPLAAFGRR
jgi:hypothetical protein